MNMQYSRTGVSTTTAAVAVVLVIAVIAVGAYVGLNPGGNPANSSSASTSTSAIGQSSTTSHASGTTTSQSTGQAFTLTSAVTLTAGGSTFVNPIMQVWASAFHNTTTSGPGVITVNYASVGSGAGQNNLYSGTFAFAGSDAPVAGSKLANFTAKGGPLLQIPETLGGVAVFYNVPGMTNSTCSSNCEISLRFNGTVLAKIYLEQVIYWDDPAIVQLNPGVSIPHTAIVPVHRSDGSGTTYAFTDYLQRVYAGWNSSGVGQGTTVNWPTGELAGKGSSGVAGLVSQNPGAIGYADTYYAFKNKLAVGSVANSQGNYILPTLASITSAAADFSAQLATDPTHSIVNARGANSYPISTFTYLLAWKNQNNQGNAYAIATFFLWMVTSGQAYGPNLFYPSLPTSMVSIDQQLIAEINYQGQTFTAA